MPVGALSQFGSSNDYPINLFFWFFQSRQDPATAPLALWLNGGPGDSSLKGLFHGTGPCTVNKDSKTTTLNPWSWNNYANVLYVDQPVQAGFSYDELRNGARGTTASQNAFRTANTTGNAARTMWLFMQTFLAEFPEHKQKDNSLSIWSTGYAGRFAPTFAAYFLRESRKRDAKTVPIKIDTIGIVNGL
jgi:carboxypeptidase D